MKPKRRSTASLSKAASIKGFQRERPTVSGQILSTFRAMVLISLMPFLILLSAFSALGSVIITKLNGQQPSSKENQSTEKRKP